MTDLMREACLIDGQWVTADKWIAVDNPATGERIGRVPRCSGKQVEQAIDAAARAMIPWAQRPAKERASVLRRYFDLIMADQEALAALLTREHGKPLAEARGEHASPAHPQDWNRKSSRE